ncbi:glucan endo-1,3-beta-D-glucosidase-like [Apium graveolens]|uniref:glucan endo-1,3-beta-D-glucosidase-like n=1 Tax=Apium graveolens TaxID=4045 RepID=UPI003D78CE36
MAKQQALYFCLLNISLVTVATLTMAHGEKTWCVAKPSTDEIALQNNIEYACTNVDCSTFLQPGCPCYTPDNRINHASVAMNVYYQRQGRNKWNCDFNNSAIVTITDPSYGGCVFE